MDEKNSSAIYPSIVGHEIPTCAAPTPQLLLFLPEAGLLCKHWPRPRPPPLLEHLTVNLFNT